MALVQDQTAIQTFWASTEHIGVVVVGCIVVDISVGVAPMVFVLEALDRPVVSTDLA